MYWGKICRMYLTPSFQVFAQNFLSQWCEPGTQAHTLPAHFFFFSRHLAMSTILCDWRLCLLFPSSPPPLTEHSLRAEICQFCCYPSALSRVWLVGPSKLLWNEGTNANNRNIYLTWLLWSFSELKYFMCLTQCQHRVKSTILTSDDDIDFIIVKSPYKVLQCPIIGWLNLSANYKSSPSLLTEAGVCELLEGRIHISFAIPNIHVDP